MCIRSELYIFLLYLLLEGVHYHSHVLHDNRHLIHSDYLHTYRMCIVQLERLDKKDAAVAKRLLADIFWIDVDDRVRELGSTSSTVRARGKRELVEQFYGLSFAYTEGAAKDDCVLASALWRCVVIPHVFTVHMDVQLCG